jgi:hypothetical protein
LANLLFSILCAITEFGGYEIEMVVVAAARIEGCVAMRAARIGLEIRRDGNFGAAGSAKDGWSVPFSFRPGFEGVAGQRVVAVFAGVIGGATFHLDGDDIEGGVVVKAAGLGVEAEASDFGSLGHKKIEGKG